MLRESLNERVNRVLLVGHVSTVLHSAFNCFNRVANFAVMAFPALGSAVIIADRLMGERKDELGNGTIHLQRKYQYVIEEQGADEAQFIAAKSSLPRIRYLHSIGPR